MRSSLARRWLARLLVATSLALAPAFAASAMTFTVGSGAGGMICDHPGMKAPAKSAPGKSQTKCPCCSAGCLTGVAKAPSLTNLAAIDAPRSLACVGPASSRFSAPALRRLSAATSPRGPPSVSL